MLDISLYYLNYIQLIGNYIIVYNINETICIHVRLFNNNRDI